ncbi:MAG TPA: hypothetical protein VMR34_05205 [Candidatus Saccharimonadales bacterium]|nr:hypothetical protein [Candidatus Saccharimonadales bacterium]
MMRGAGFTWKSLYTSLIDLSEKLEELGLVEVGGKTVLIEDNISYANFEQG